MSTQFLDTLIETFDAYIDDPLHRFWRDFSTPSLSGNLTQTKYYLYTAMTAALYILALLFIFISLRCLFSPTLCPLSNHSAALMPFSAALIPLLLIGLHRLRMKYKAEDATHKPETYPQALRIALQQTEGITLDEDSLELALLSALLAVNLREDSDDE